MTRLSHHVLRKSSRKQELWHIKIFLIFILINLSPLTKVQQSSVTLNKIAGHLATTCIDLQFTDGTLGNWMTYPRT